MITQYLYIFFFYPFKPSVESFWGVLSCCLSLSSPNPYTTYCLTSGIKNKNLRLIYFNILTRPYPVGHRNESEWKNIRKTKQKRVRGDKG